MVWKLVEPSGKEFTGEITPLTLAEARTLRGGWFNWHEYMKRKDRQHVQVYKLQRFGRRDILGLISVFYNDGVVIDSLEISPHSRRMPLENRVYMNLCEIMIAYAAYWGIERHNDGFVGLQPKTGLQQHYMKKFNAFPMSMGLYGIETPVTSALIRLYYIKGDDHDAEALE